MEGLPDRGDGGRVDGPVGKEHLDAVLLVLVAHRPVALEAHAIGWNALLGEPGQRGRGHLPEQRVELGGAPLLDRHEVRDEKVPAQVAHQHAPRGEDVGRAGDHDLAHPELGRELDCMQASRAAEGD